MNLIQTFDQLKDYSLYDCEQFWYYVILINPQDMTEAGKAVFRNLNIFHLDSGEECQYFIPGFLNTGKGIFTEIMSLFSLQNRPIDVPGFGKLNFNDRNFVGFYKELEGRNSIGWRYSGECELLLFNLSSGNKIKLNDFVSYNLDDIIRNKRNVSEFIRATINVGKDATDQIKAKQILDEKFYDMIMPEVMEQDSTIYEKGWDTLKSKGFKDDSYLFISYSSKDFPIVSKIRGNLLSSGIPCWMAPFDIPQGCNYSLIIEHAIKHSQKFVLMLSKSAVESVWVGKELKRAIARFQANDPEKICVVWLNGIFELRDTPFALPLEDVQIKGINLDSNPGNYYLLASEEKRNEIQRENKIQKYREEINRCLSPDKLIPDLRKVVSMIHAINSSKAQGKSMNVINLCNKLNCEIDIMEKSKDMRSKEFTEHYLAAIDILNEIRQYTDCTM